MNNQEEAITGLWLSEAGQLHVSTRDGAERKESSSGFEPYCWAPEPLMPEVCSARALEGEEHFSYLLEFENLESYKDALKDRDFRSNVEQLKPFEHQWLLMHAKRMYKGMVFKDLRRCQVDIETAFKEGSFSSARRKDDRILAVGMQMGEATCLIELEDLSDEAETQLLESFTAKLKEWDPDTIEGHNIFKFDLDYLRQRSKRFGLRCQWGRFGEDAKFRNSRLRVAERWLDYSRCDIPGRTVVDTYFISMMHDISNRDMPSYSLKEVAKYFGISDPETRTYLSAENIQKSFHENRDRFRDYLKDDLRETQGIASILLPTFFAQCANFPMLMQEVLLRGTGSKIDLLFMEQYAQRGCSLPLPPMVNRFEGAFSRSFESGVFRHILHFDVASLYPSLLLLIGRNPQNDEQGVFMPLLKQLKAYRLKYKQLARETNDSTLKNEYNSRQASYKIIINSFYGYLGFSGARFADGALAAEVTERGRNLLQELIKSFQELGCCVVEADTDGIYLASEQWYDKQEALLEKVCQTLPDGIELECDGRYESMFAYKAKNYALYDGDKVLIRGSALRSRGTEFFLKELTDTMIHSLLGASDLAVADAVRRISAKIENGEMPIEQLARREYLSQNPDAYQKAVESGNKPRRASLEVALRSQRKYKSGDQVAYYITRGEKKRAPDWQTARELETYDPQSAPYNPDYYLKKIKDWQKRYEAFLPAADGEQTELFDL